MSKYLIASKVKELIHEKDMDVAQNYFEALDIKIERIIIKSIERAMANNRKTILPRDL